MRKSSALDISSWFLRSWARKLGAWFAVDAGMIAATYSAADDSLAPLTLLWFLIFATFWSVLFSVVDVRAEYLNEFRETIKAEPDLLEACLHVLHRAAIQIKDVEPVRDLLRITVQEVNYNSETNKPESFVQIVPYVGGRGRGVGRVTRLNCGIVGKVLQEGAPFGSRRLALKDSDYIAALMVEFNFTKRECQSLRLDRWSAFGIPIFDPRDDATVARIVYMDSSDPDFFDDNINNQLVELTEGIYDYLRKRRSRH